MGCFGWMGRPCRLRSHRAIRRGIITNSVCFAIFANEPGVRDPCAIREATRLPALVHRGCGRPFRLGRSVSSARVRRPLATTAQPAVRPSPDPPVVLAD